MGFLGSLLGGVGSLVSGIFGANASEKNTQANIAEQNFLSSGGNLSALRANATAAGYNPLAVLGQNFGSAPMTNVSNPMSGLGDMGQSIDRAIQAYNKPEDKEGALRQELLRAQIDQINMDTASKAARTFAAPGTPPGMATRSAGAGISRMSNFLFPEAMTDFAGRHGERITSQSPEFAQTQFGLASQASGIPVAAGVVRENVENAGLSLRPDVARQIYNVNPLDIMTSQY